MVRRGLALLTTMLVTVVASIAWAVAAPPASASPELPARVPGGACSLEEWGQDLKGCVNRLAEVGEDRASCLNPQHLVHGNFIYNPLANIFSKSFCHVFTNII